MAKAVSIDPSINRVGWACVKGIYRRKDGGWNGDKAKWSYGYWDIPGCLLRTKFRHIVEHIIVELGGLDPEQDDQLIVEWPEYFDVERGQIAAKQGHTINLAAIDAFVAGFFRMPDDQWYPLFPRDWKGNLNKEIVRRRFFKELGIKRVFAVDHNAMEAAMMLLYWCRKYRVANRILEISYANLESTEIEDS